MSAVSDAATHVMRCGGLRWYVVLHFESVAAPSQGDQGLPQMLIRTLSVAHIDGG